MNESELEKYLNSVTDKLCGQLLQVCTPNHLSPEAEQKAEQLKYVWELMHYIDAPDPDDATMERLYQGVLDQLENGEIDEDELDQVVGAGKPKDPPTSEE